MLKHLEALRIWLVVRLVWSSPRRMADAVRGFQATEADGVWHLHRGLRRVTDPKQRAVLFTHSLEEEAHAEAFGYVYRDMAKQVLPPPTYEREDIYAADAPLWRSVAFVHVGEEDATERFRNLYDALPEGDLKRVLVRIVADEDTHVGLTERMLAEMGATPDEVRRAYLQVRLGRLWEMWLRGGKRVVDAVASVILSAAYLVLGVFLTEPSRARLGQRVVEYDNNRLKRLA